MRVVSGLRKEDARVHAGYEIHLPRKPSWSWRLQRRKRDQAMAKAPHTQPWIRNEESVYARACVYMVKTVRENRPADQTD